MWKNAQHKAIVLCMVKCRDFLQVINGAFSCHIVLYIIFKPQSFERLLQLIDVVFTAMTHWLINDELLVVEHKTPSPTGTFHRVVQLGALGNGNGLLILLRHLFSTEFEPRVNFFGALFLGWIHCPSLCAWRWCPLQWLPNYIKGINITTATTLIDLCAQIRCCCCTNCTCSWYDVTGRDSCWGGLTAQGKMPSKFKGWSDKLYRTNKLQASPQPADHMENDAIDWPCWKACLW